MKSRKRGRPQSGGVPIHPLLRLSEGAFEIHSRYSPEERSEVYERALSTIFPSAKSQSIPPVLIRPMKIETDTICRVVVEEPWVRLFFPEKRDDFRELVKRFRYAWDNCWERRFTKSVDILDRAAEIAAELLLAGFCVQVDNESVRSRAIAASYQPEPFKTIRRVTKGLYKDYFILEWPRADDCYGEAMKITAAKYSDGSVYVPSEHFLEIEDFAEINDFVLSEGAIALAAEAKAAKEAAIIVSPKRKAKKAPKTPKKNECSNIPAHLRDDGDD